MNRYERKAEAQKVLKLDTEKAEGKSLVIMDVATMVPSGLVELIELERAGWTYVKP